MRFRCATTSMHSSHLISRRLIELLRKYGDFYQSAFPDYYSMNAAFLRAQGKSSSTPARVVIGVTPSHMAISPQQQGDGGAQIPRRDAARRPRERNQCRLAERGDRPRAGNWHRVRAARGPSSLSTVQAAYVYNTTCAGGGGLADVRGVERELPLLERWVYRGAYGGLALVRGCCRPLEALRSRAAAGAWAAADDAADVRRGRYSDILQVCAASETISLDMRPTPVGGGVGARLAACVRVMPRAAGAGARVEGTPRGRPSARTAAT